MSSFKDTKPIRSPQAEINNFWARFSTKKPSKVTSIFPRLLYASLLPEHPDPRGISSSCNAADSYEAAAAECRAKVERIVRECERTNEKFIDSDFDIESDFDGRRNCLIGLEYETESDEPPPPPPLDGSRRSGSIRSFDRGRGMPRRKGGVECRQCYRPNSIHRVEWIFEKPQFTIDGFSSSDVEQGADGDCWWLAAVATIAHRKDLMNKVCVARDEECGVYGFVFHRDGEWISTVVDDNLYLTAVDFADVNGEMYDATGEKARKWRLQQQTGSEALYFSKCCDPNETWLPLMEKAYAKAHGDYDAISGGWSGEAVEDMTGGVTTTIATKRVLRKQALWKELSQDVGDFVFALSAIGRPGSTSGVVLGHAYSILDATEVLDEEGVLIQLVKIRNPWGKRNAWNGTGEWNGRWSDGSKEWTPFMMKKLDHKFGDDGTFWMLYEDMLEMFKFLHRTRLFDERWTVVQQWTSCDVSWITGYSLTKFVIDVKNPGMVVIVLSQLDERYFTGLEGQYNFELHFLLKKQGSSSDEYLCRVRPTHEWENRSVSCEINLEPGRYEVLPKITATRDKDVKPIERLVEYFAEKNPQKLRQVGMQYDLAHAKGGVPDEDQRIETWKAEKKKQEAQRRREEREANRQERMQVEVDVILPARRSPTPTADLEGKTPVHDGEMDDFQDAAESLHTEGSRKSVESRDGVGKPLARRATNGLKKRLTFRRKPQQLNVPVAETGVEISAERLSQERPQTAEIQVLEPNSPLPEERAEKHKKKDKDDENDKEDEKEKHKHEKKDESVEDEDSSESSDDDDDRSMRWNAVCVVCLRVYSKDPELSIILVKPGLAEETSSLVQGGEPAGATM